jgi:hypothetical protein
MFDPLLKIKRRESAPMPDPPRGHEIGRAASKSRTLIETPGSP